MQTIGERLLEARQRRGVSIREAAEFTKVRGDYLAAMENNQFDSIPLADVYRRGFLKIYGRFLRLDADRLVGDYNAILAARSPSSARVRRGSDVDAPAVRSELREGDPLDDFSSGAVEVASRPQGADTKWRWIAGAAAAVVLVSLAFVFWPSSSPEASDSVAASPAMPAALYLGSSHTAPLTVQIYEYDSATGKQGRLLVSKEIVSGSMTPVPGVVGDVLVSASPLSKLIVELNGVRMSSYGPDYNSGRLTVPAPTARSGR